MNDLLKVLDMSEVEQWEWLEKKYGPGAFHSFAPLAFRLRDEACKVSCEKYYEALEEVYNHRIKDKQCCSFYAFLTYRIRPIDMIIACLTASIAALMAKDKANV